MIKKLYDNKLLSDVVSLKCSTARDKPRAPRSDKGVIIFYCSDSENEKHIMSIGNNIAKHIFEDYDANFIYYKSDSQTLNGTRATRANKNHLYRINIYLLKNKKY